jgi:DNA repair exonuclease SbcCD ATPase subunit
MQTLFVDEGDFGNLDEAGIREAIAVVRNLTKEFSRVILISHIDEIREIFHGYTVEVLKTSAIQSAIRTPSIDEYQPSQAVSQ